MRHFALKVRELDPAADEEMMADKLQSIATEYCERAEKMFQYSR